VKIFVYSGGQQTGPYTKEAIRRELLNGSLKPSDLAWHNRLRRWVPLHLLPMSEPKSKKKYPVPPLPEDSPYYTPAAQPESTLPRSEQKTLAPGDWLEWFTRRLGGRK